MDFSDYDLLGVFESNITDGGDDDFHVPVTYEHYRELVRMMAERLGVSVGAAMHALNVEPVGASPSEAGTDDTQRCHANPPLCVHLSRESVHRYHNHESLLPTITCRRVVAEEDMAGAEVADVHHSHRGTTATATTTVARPVPALAGVEDGACREGPPHVHCCYCFQEALDRAAPARPGVPPPAVDELVSLEASTGVPAWCSHFAEHERRKRKYWGMLDDEVIAYLGESGDEFDLDTEDGRGACEEAAGNEARHGCFMVSAGTAACPFVLFYCAYCEQFAPLLHVTWAEQGWTIVPEDADITWPVLMAKLFVAFHLWRQSRSLVSPQPAPGDSCGGHATRYVFVYKPELFSSPSAVESFEEGVEATHGAVILPEATVMVRDGEGRSTDTTTGCTPCLVLSPETLVSPAALRQRPLPYTFSVAVEGFLMMWPTAAEASAKCAMAMACDNSYRVIQRLVYIAETASWEWAHVLFHDTTDSDSRGWRAFHDGDDDGTGAIRVLTDVVVPTAVPGDASPSMSADEIEHDDDNVAMVAAPFSMEARTMDFFGRMTLLAKAMAEVSQRQHRPPA